MLRLLFGLALLLLPTQVMALSQFTPAAVNGGYHLTTPAAVADKQSSTFMMDGFGSLNVNIAGTSVPVTVVVTPTTFDPLGDSNLTVTGPVAVLTSTGSGGLPATANYAIVCSIGSTVLWSETAIPTTTTGQFLSGGTATPPSIPVCTTFGPSPHSAFTTQRWIEQTGSGTATLHFTFFLAH